MKRLMTALTLTGAMTFAVGCSEQTQKEASEAASAIGEAAESAAKDTAENTEKAIDATKETIDDIQADNADRAVPDAE